MRSADLAPIPGALAIALESPAIMANLRSSAVIADKIPKAPLGPIPFTVISFLNIHKSSLVRKPYNMKASSLTQVYV